MAAQSPYERDLEKIDEVGAGSATDDGSVPGETFVQGNTLYARVQRLAAKFHVEQRGIERVPEDERDDNSLLNVGTMVSHTPTFRSIWGFDFVGSGFQQIWSCHPLPSVFSHNHCSSLDS